MALGDPDRRRILFVDDESKVLDGLRRLLHPMRKHWDIVFVTSAEQALEALALEPFEVIVTDMRMPGVDGAELLEQVVRRFPQVIRLVLSGQWDMEMSMRSAKTAHQYLTKPCSAEMLKATLDRIFTLRHALSGRALQRLVSGMTTLPSLPSLYLELTQVLASQHANSEQIGSIIGRDMAMTAKILQLSNSALFGVSRHLSYPAEAALFLGTDAIKSLVLTIGVFSQFEGPPSAQTFLARLQQHCLQVARITQVIAKEERVPKPIADDAFLAALMHDIGKLILMQKDVEMYEQVLALACREKLEIDTIEREVFGASHAEVGYYLLWLWGFSEPVLQALADHHTPEISASPAISATVLVHVADALAHEFDPFPGHSAALAESFVRATSLAERVEAWRSAARPLCPIGAAP